MQYGLRHLTGLEVPYPSEDLARAAQERMRKWPTTKYVELICRSVVVGAWEAVL